ncbi:uncharacterized protein CCR75_000602 [Bremia lactucae]|uniref:Uncharacterized protein n=1 Tax=Bremia lactucae TaxID=4779 RepID=A0A976FDJ6_BRELC|nr:hypothetical protein CCR75_000602 [Bremia lactucae]
MRTFWRQTPRSQLAGRLQARMLQSSYTAATSTPDDAIRFLVIDGYVKAGRKGLKAGGAPLPDSYMLICSSRPRNTASAALLPTTSFIPSTLAFNRQI